MEWAFERGTMCRNETRRLKLDLPLERLGTGWRSVVEDIGDGLFGGNVPLTPV
jgi:hypothetical protein